MFLDLLTYINITDYYLNLNTFLSREEHSITNNPSTKSIIIKSGGFLYLGADYLISKYSKS